MRKTNLKNRILISALSVGFAAMLSACGIENSPYTEEEIDKIGEYAALLMLGNDPDESRLVDIEEPEQETVVIEDEEPLPEPEPEVPDEPEESNTPTGTDIDIIEIDPEEVATPSVGLDEFLGFADGLTITYKGYEWRRTLTNESGSYFYDPAEGKYFLIINYNIYNASGDTQDVDFLYAGLTFSLKINSEKSITAYEIPINEDMPTYIGRLQNGSGVDLMLTFECDSNLFENINSMELTVKSKEDSCKVVLE